MPPKFWFSVCWREEENMLGEFNYNTRPQSTGLHVPFLLGLHVLCTLFDSAFALLAFLDDYILYPSPNLNPMPTPILVCVSGHC